MVISIIGCGWLGLPLARELVRNGHIVNGSTTREEKIAVLQAAQILPFILDLRNDKPFDEVNLPLLQSDIIVINIITIQQLEESNIIGFQKGWFNKDLIINIFTLQSHI